MNGKTVRCAFLITAFLAGLTILVFSAFSSISSEWIISSEFTVSPEWTISSTFTPNESPPQTSSSQIVLFKVTLNGVALENCQIRISTSTYQDYIGTYMTDSEGKATAYLPVGTYDYSATYQQKRVSGTFQHIQEETVELELGTGETIITRKIPALDKTQIMKIGIALIVVVGAVFGIVTVTKKKRW